MTHIIYCEPHMNQSSWASPAEVPVTDVLQDSSEGLQILDKTLSKQASADTCPHKKHANQSLLPGSSPGGLCGAPSSAGEISVQIFSNKYCFSKFSFSGQSFHQKQDSGKHPRRCASRVPSNSFIHSCMSCFKQLQVFGQAVSHTRMQSNRELAFWPSNPELL